MAWVPHEYTLRNKAPDPVRFERVVAHIRSVGYVIPWGKYNNTYLDFDGWRYWTMGAPIEETTLINRAKLDFYNAVADNYDDIFSTERHQREDAELTQMIGDLSGESVLDIGCGTGKLLELATPRDYLGVDPSEAMIIKAKKKFPNASFRAIAGELALKKYAHEKTMITALFSASYLNPKVFDDVAKLRLFLIFCCPHYRPACHDAFNRSPQMWRPTIRSLRDLFPGADVMLWAENYHIVQR